jgi:hypothetical protein
VIKHLPVSNLGGAGLRPSGSAGLGRTLESTRLLTHREAKAKEKGLKFRSQTRFIMIV